MFEREQKKLAKHFDDMSANVLEAKHALDKIWYDEKFEKEYGEAYSDVCTALDKFNIVRKDFEKLRDKVRRNDV